MAEDMFTFRYVFNEEEQLRIDSLPTFLEPETQSKIIHELVTTTPYWDKVSFSDQLTWLEEELTFQNLIAYAYKKLLPHDLAKHHIDEIPPLDDLIVSYDFEDHPDDPGTDIVITLGVFADVPKKPTSRVVDIKGYRDRSGQL